jgi:hypothetical protein
VKVSKQTVAREWLIFLACLCLALFVTLVAVSYGVLPRKVIHFWETHGELRGLALVLLFPYLIVTLLRSIFWSIKTLVAPRSQSEHS